MTQSTDSSPKVPVIGTVFGAGEGVAIGGVAYVLFENPVFAAGVGVMAALGGALFIPYILSVNALQEGEITADALPGGRMVHTGALGAALSSAAIIGLAAMFIIESAAVPLAVAFGYAAVSFLALRFILPDADSLANGDADVDVTVS